MIFGDIDATVRTNGELHSLITQMSGNRFLVDFAAQVRPDGTVESVEFKSVPLPQLGFEDALRACIAEWRFEPGAAGEGIRRYDGHMRFRLDAVRPPPLP